MWSRSDRRRGHFPRRRPLAGGVAGSDRHDRGEARAGEVRLDRVRRGVGDLELLDVVTVALHELLGGVDEGSDRDAAGTGAGGIDRSDGLDATGVGDHRLQIGALDLHEDRVTGLVQRQDLRDDDLLELGEHVILRGDADGGVAGAHLLLEEEDHVTRVLAEADGDRLAADQHVHVADDGLVAHLHLAGRVLGLRRVDEETEAGEDGVDVVGKAGAAQVTDATGAGEFAQSDPVVAVTDDGALGDDLHDDDTTEVGVVVLGGAAEKAEQVTHDVSPWLRVEFSVKFPNVGKPRMRLQVQRITGIK